MLSFLMLFPMLSTAVSGSNSTNPLAVLLGMLSTLSLILWYVLFSDSPIFLVLIHGFQHIYLDQLAQDPATLARSNYLHLLVTTQHAYELFHRKHNLTYVFPATYKQIQAFLTQHDKLSVSVFFFLYSCICFFFCSKIYNVMLGCSPWQTIHNK